MVHIWEMEDMKLRKKSVERVGVTAFKSQCLALIDAVAQGKTERVVLLKHERPVAQIVPIAASADARVDLWGAMRGTVSVAPGVDLTEPTGEAWDAEL